MGVMINGVDQGATKDALSQTSQDIKRKLRRGEWIAIVALVISIASLVISIT